MQYVGVIFLNLCKKYFMKTIKNILTIYLN